MDKIAKRAFKLFKTNRFTLDEVAELCKVSKEELERRFRAWCGDRFVYPGIYLVGGWHEQIAEAIKKWRKVLVIGDVGSGKTVNAVHAAKMVSKKVEHVYSLSEFENKVTARFRGIIFLDDVDCMGRNWKKVLEKSSAVKEMRIVATASKNALVSGFHKIRIKPPSSKELKELASMKDWKMVEGSHNLRDLSKANTYDGGILKEKKVTILTKVKDVLSGKGTDGVNKSIIEQVLRNGYEMDHSIEKVEELCKACAGAWLFMYSRGDPSALLSTIKKTSGASSIMYRKGVIDD